MSISKINAHPSSQHVVIITSHVFSTLNFGVSFYGSRGLHHRFSSFSTGQVAPEALGAWQVALKPQERRAWQYFTLCRALVKVVKVVTADLPWTWMRMVDEQ